MKHAVLSGLMRGLRNLPLQTPTTFTASTSLKNNLAARTRLAPSRAMASGQIDHDVTRANFSEKLPAIRQALQECSFFAFDLEMTGLFMDSCHANYLDDVQDRYTKVRDNASAFEISQFGLSCFKLSQDGRSYEAKTFNAYLFPEPLAWDGANTRKFMCDAGSMSFLAHEGFDFNKWVRQGVSYLPLKQYEQRMQQAQQSYQVARNEVVIDKLRDIEFVARLLDQVKAWLAGDEPILQLTLANSFERLLCFQELARKSNFVPMPEERKAPEETRGEVLSPEEAARQRAEGCAAGAQAQEQAAEEAWHRGFFIKKVEVNGMGQLQLIRTPTPADLERVMREDQEERLLAVKGASGFSAVMEAMRDSHRPAVGHNCLFDIMFVMATFVDPRLPRHWDDAKKLIANWFPGGIYDTKHLASILPEEIQLYDTSLGQLYASLTLSGSPQQVAAASAMRFLSSHMDMSLSIPQVKHAPGFTQYLNTEVGASAHEAGYDAFMTGTVFSVLAPLVHAAGSSRSSGKPLVPPAGEASAAAEQGPTAMDMSDKEDDAASQGSWDIAAQYQPLQYITQHVGRLNLSRSDMPYMAIWGKDPVLERPHVLHLVNLGASYVHPNDVGRRLQAAGAPGRLRVTGLPSSSIMGGYLVEMDTTAMSEAGLTMEQLVGNLRAALSTVAPTAWQVQVQEAGEGVATGKGVGPWAIQSWADFAYQKQQLLTESQLLERGGRSVKRPRTTAGQERPAAAAASPHGFGGVISKCTIS